MASPKPHAELTLHETEPLNGGPALPDLVASYLTPEPRWFIRNHGPVPAVDPASFRLEVAGLVERPLSLSLAELADLPRHTVVAALQCAGNRRTELAAVAPIPGELPWGAEAIANGAWSGFRLADVLARAGVRPEAAHVAFTGLDPVSRLGTTFGFGGSVPLAKALHPDTLLADTINGAPLTPAHGAPLRALVPGYIGARSVKWLASITLQAEPSANYFQRRAYRLFPPDATPDSVDWDSGLMLGEAPLNAVIATPADGATLSPGPVTLRGYAAAGGDRTIARVDVSADGGQTWQQAQLEADGGPWSWSLWSLPLVLAPGTHHLVVRAVDSSGTMQPATPDHGWNFKGYMSNAWHRITLTIAE